MDTHNTSSKVAVVLGSCSLRQESNLLIKSSSSRLKSEMMTWLSCFKFLRFLDKSKARRLSNLWKMRVLLGVRELATEAWVLGQIVLIIFSPRWATQNVISVVLPWGELILLLVSISISSQDQWDDIFCSVGVSESTLTCLWVRPEWVSHKFTQYPGIEGQHDATMPF